MINNGKLRIKEYPKTLSKTVEEKYIKDGKLIVDLENIKISPVHTALIIFYYYDYLDFMFKAGNGRVLHKQLEKFMKDYHNISTKYTRNMIEEMFFYRLIEKDNKWNNCFLKMTSPAYSFFSGGKKLNIPNEIGSIKRSIIMAEHYLRNYKPDKTENFKTIMEIRNVLQNERLEQLENNNIFLANIEVSRESKDNLIITFGIIDVADTLTVKHIKEKIELINSFFNLNDNYNCFKVNVNTQNTGRNKFLQNKWNKETPYINASLFNGNIKFTNLNTKRYFCHNHNTEAKAEKEQ
ncbi:hypothetical protein SDC9_48152 [bioreactor metagenome]|uniref:Uncharacterized protein n=1 Tax=bioreactor metagenome TaxID=1076179 RepID=A0A644WDR8_9ZZZZ